jgi:hypothetical protein
MKVFVALFTLAFARQHAELPVDERSGSPSYLTLFANGVQLQTLSIKSAFFGGENPICFAVDSAPETSTSFVPSGNLLVVTTFESSDCTGNGKESKGGFGSYRREVFKGIFEVVGARSIQLKTTPKYS